LGVAYRPLKIFSFEDQQQRAAFSLGVAEYCFEKPVCGLEAYQGTV
jgi:hypothetical protein